LGGDVHIAGLQVEVALSRSVPMTLLAYVGISQRRVAVERTVLVIDS
jgi:hypothetical protein